MCVNQILEIRLREYPLCLLFILFFSTINKSEAVHLEVTSDQPTVLDSNITFYAKLHHPDKISYDIFWVENYPNDRSFGGKLSANNSFTSNWTLNYPAKKGKTGFIPGSYAVTTTVTYEFIFSYNVATKVTYYNVTRNFTGEMEIIQPGVPKSVRTDISTMNETEFFVRLHDPSEFLKQADNVTWMWYDQSSFIENTTSPNINLNFTKEGEYYVNVTLEAIYNYNTSNNFTKHGFFETNITAKVPIVNFTVAGDAWFPHGKLLDLRISCDGTQPFIYCWWIRSGSHNKTGNETCMTETVTNDCEFPITWYFNEPGIHSLFIVIKNDVSYKVNRTLINVYKVSRKQPLSIIVVPISCSVIAMVVIIFGVAYFWENHTRYTIEVADFDFGQNDELPYMTFLERLRDAMSAGPNNRQRLLPPPDDEPILSS